MKINFNCRYHLLLYWLTVFGMASCGSPAAPITAQVLGANSLGSNGCLPPIYEGFSYPVKADNENLSYPGLDMLVLPPNPWHIEAYLPEFPGLTNWVARRLGVIQTRQVDDYSEIWIHISRGLEEQEYLAVYRTDSKEWKIIPEQINALFVNKNGSLWGNRSGIGSAPFDSRVLSKYDEETSTFTVVEEVQNIASGIEKTGSYLYNQVLLDNDGTFWILVPEDGIYRYNPSNGEMKRFFDLPVTFNDADMTADGTIYVLVYDQFIKDGNLVTQSFLNYYVPGTGGASGVALNSLLEPYPYPLGVLIDHKDRIWLDNIAYRREDGTWHQIQRSPLFVAPVRETYSDYRYKRADVVLESSDGRIWFLHPNNGMIYLDPEKGEWCWFTTYQSNIVEDSDHNLWMIADNKLYKYSLNP